MDKQVEAFAALLKQLLELKQSMTKLNRIELHAKTLVRKRVKKMLRQHVKKTKSCMRNELRLKMIY